MASPLELRIENGERLREVARAIRKFDDRREIQKRLRKGLKATAEDLLKAEKAAVRRLPSKNQNARRGRPSLRREVARATQIRVRTSGVNAGVLVWVNPRRMPPGKANLPAYMEGIRPFHRWRHPTFGDWEKAVQQRRSPWFYRTARPYEVRAERAAASVIDEIKTEIESRL